MTKTIIRKLSIFKQLGKIKRLEILIKSIKLLFQIWIFGEKLEMHNGWVNGFKSKMIIGLRLLNYLPCIISDSSYY